MNAENPIYDLTSKTGKRYRVIHGEDGRELWEYEPKEGKEAPIYDPQKKHLIRGSAPLITSENAARLQLMGKEKVRQDLVDGMREAVASKRKVNVQEVTEATVRQALGQAIMEHALASPFTPGSVHAKRLAADVGDMMPDKRVKPDDTPPGTVRLTVTTTIQELRKHMEDKYRDAVDGEVVGE